MRYSALLLILWVACVAPAFAEGLLLYSEPQADGAVTANTEVVTGQIIVGDRWDDKIIRGFISFNISGLPSDAIIEDAELRVYQEYASGNPVGLGDLVVDHVEHGSELDIVDFIVQPLPGGQDIGTISDDEESGRKRLCVPQAVQDDVDAGRMRSQFRLRYTVDTDFDAAADYMVFDAGEHPDVHRKPSIFIEYTVPEPEPEMTNPEEEIGEKQTPGDVIPTTTEYGFMLTALLLGLATWKYMLRREE